MNNELFSQILLLTNHLPGDAQKRIADFILSEVSNSTKPSAPKEDTYKVMLSSTGPNKIAAIRALRTASQTWGRVDEETMPPRVAKDFVDSAVVGAPTVKVFQKLSLEAATAVVHMLKDADAVAFPVKE